MAQVENPNLLRRKEFLCYVESFDNLVSPMKTLFLLPVLLLSLISCSSETDSQKEAEAKAANSLLQRDGLYYKQFSDTPFTGKLTTYYGNGQLEHQSSFKKGKGEGEITDYSLSGKVVLRGHYRDGRKHGEWVRYTLKGGLISRGSYKNGKEEGRWFFYKNYEKNRKATGTYKNGRRISD